MGRKPKDQTEQPQDQQQEQPAQLVEQQPEQPANNQPDFVTMGKQKFFDYFFPHFQDLKAKDLAAALNAKREEHQATFSPFDEKTIGTNKSNYKKSMGLSTGSSKPGASAGLIGDLEGLAALIDKFGAEEVKQLVDWIARK